MSLSDRPAPPQAEQRPYSYEAHGVTIEDPWHWLRDPKYPEVDDPDVLAYLTPRTLISRAGRRSTRRCSTSCSRR